MTWLQICVVCAVLYVIIQIVVGIWVRRRANGVLIDPVIRSKKNLKGYYAIVTGSNTGIGYEVARYLVNHGAHVVLACRNDQRGRNAEKSLNAQTTTNAVYQGGRAEYLQCDLSKLDSTKQFIASYKSKQYALHLLINNAGLAGRREPKFTQDGMDMIWQINYLSHFLITYELLPLMIQCSKDEKFDCRIVNTSSMWHSYGNIDFDILGSDQETQKKARIVGRANYGRSKLAQILHATYMQTEIFSPNNIRITAVSIHPGGVRTNIFGTQHWKLHMKAALLFLSPAVFYGFRSHEQGARNTLYCAVAPIGDHIQSWGGNLVPGAYHVNMQASVTKDEHGQSTNPKDMRKLYQLSCSQLALTPRSKVDYKAMSMPQEKASEEQKQESFGAITDDVEDEDDDEDEKDKVIDTEFEELKDGVIVLKEKSYWFYSIADAHWQKLSDLTSEQQASDGPSVVYHDRTIYRFGGRNTKSDQAMKHCEYLKLDAKGKKQWVTMPGKLNERRCSGSAIFLGDHESLLMIGGDDNGDELSSVEEYDYDERKWRMKESMNKTRNDFGICSVSDNSLLVFGGHSVDENSGISGYLDCIEKYDYNLDKWTLLNTKMPFGKRARCGAFHWKQLNQNQVIVAGGTSPARNVVECLDLEKLKWTRYADLNACHWFAKIGTLSGETPQIVYVVGVNEKSKLDVVEYIDTRQNAKKWHTQNVIKHSNDKIYAMCWV